MEKLKTLIISMLQMGMIGFGGGSALIPILQQSVVDKEKLVTQDEYEEDIVVASITPGALSAELAAGIGKQCAGKKGMLLGAIAMALPGVVMTVLMVSVMSRVDDGVFRQIEFLAVGITAFITCLLTEYISKTWKESIKRSSVSKTLIIIMGVFILTCGKNLFRIFQIEGVPFFSLSTIDVFLMAFFVIFYTNGLLTPKHIIISAGFCLLYALSEGKAQIISNSYVSLGIKVCMLLLSVTGIRKCFRGKLKIEKKKLKDAGIEVAVLTGFMLVMIGVAMFITEKTALYAWNGFLSTIMSFGGGDAYLTVSDGFFVHTGLISEDEFYSCLVPVVNIFPGSILCKMLSGIGYYVGYNETGSVLAGYVVSAAGFACSVGASCGVFSLVSCAYRELEKIEVFQILKRWIKAIVSGLMLNVILSLIYQNYKLGIEIGQSASLVICMLGIYVLDIILYYKVKMRNSGIVLVSMFLAFAVCNMLIL
ncbi:MAG: chromate transporter [Roseburia sp.]|nr:chromate transporter [Roseburia sp.]